MPTDLHLMTLMQWLSPGFPISSYAYSHGLEMAIAEGHVTDAESLHDWLDGLLIHGTGRSDAIWVRVSYDATDNDELGALNAQANAFIPARERRIEAQKQGAAFVRTINEVWEADLPKDLLLPLAVGAAARRQAIAPDIVAPLYLQAFLTNLVASAQRLMPLGQTEGQHVLSRLHPQSLSVARATQGLSVSDIHSVAFMSDIMAMRHETLQPRLFHT
ncbi:MAG: urease accessory UreF family protein [Pseudomonadota bacterium]